MTDDVLVFSGTLEEHTEFLILILGALEESGITLNGDKCQFYMTKLTFFGLTFSSEGIAPTEDRVAAIRNASRPKDAKDLRSFLGMTGFSNRFIVHLQTITEPFKHLMKKGATWKLTDKEEDAFKKLKASISENFMAYFDKTWLTEVIVDASPVGLSAILIQVNPNDKFDRRIVVVKSRLLTDVETRYSQCEKEALAAVWGCEGLWPYLMGHHFKLLTDNRAIQLIFGNASSRPPARIERWALRLSQFDYTIEHCPGISNPADYLSRHPDLTVSLDELVKQQETDSSRKMQYLWL